MLHVLPLSCTDRGGDGEEAGAHDATSFEDGVDQCSSGASVSVLERVDGLELQVADGGEQKGMLSGAAEVLQEILHQGGDLTRRRGHILCAELVPAADPHVHPAQTFRGAHHSQRTMDLLDITDGPFIAPRELLDRVARRLDVAGHAHGLVIAQVVLLIAELGVGDVPTGGIDAFDPRGGDGLGAQEQGVDAPSRRLIDLRGGRSDEAGDLECFLPQLPPEQSSHVLLGETCRHVVGVGAAPSFRRRRTSEVGLLTAWQP